MKGSRDDKTASAWIVSLIGILEVYKKRGSEGIYEGFYDTIKKETRDFL